MRICWGHGLRERMFSDNITVKIAVCETNEWQRLKRRVWEKASRIKRSPTRIVPRMVFGKKNRRREFFPDNYFRVRPPCELCPAKYLNNSRIKQIQHGFESQNSDRWGRVVTWTRVFAIRGYDRKEYCIHSSLRLSHYGSNLVYNHMVSGQLVSKVSHPKSGNFFLCPWSG